jgi:hypothetical protein
MWEKQHLIAAMVNADQVGTMYQFSSEKYSLALAVVLGSSSTQLRLAVINGEYEFMSDWLDVAPQLEQRRMDQLLTRVLERWQVRYTSPYSGRTNGLTPVELITDLWGDLEPLLA